MTADIAPLVPEPVKPAEAKYAFHEVPLGDLLTAQPNPVRFLFSPLLPRRHVTLLGGHGGIGKSMLSLALAAHAACGQPWAGLTVEGPTKTVVLSMEDEGDLVRYRLRQVVEAYGLDGAAVLANLRVLDGTEAMPLMGENEFRRLERWSMEMLQEMAKGSGLIVIDNASDAYDGDENKRRDVRAFIRELARLAKACDAAVVLLAHIDKQAARHGGGDNSYSGSTAWHNSARSRLALVKEDEAIELRQEKLNLGRKADPIRIEIRDGVPIPASQVSGEADTSQLLARADADAIYEVVRVAIETGITVPTANTGPATAWHALEPLPELGDTYRTREGKRRVRAALIHLQRDGRLVKGAYDKPNRHVGERWELAQDASVEG